MLFFTITKTLAINLIKMQLILEKQFKTQKNKQFLNFLVFDVAWPSAVISVTHIFFTLLTVVFVL